MICKALGNRIRFFAAIWQHKGPRRYNEGKLFHMRKQSEEGESKLMKTLLRPYLLIAESFILEIPVNKQDY